MVAAVLLRVVGLGERALFRDEAASWLEASYPLPALLQHASGEPYPPLYALLLHAWLPLFGDGETSLRALSVLPGVGLVLVVWRWASESLGRWPGLVALAVVSFSPLAIANARDARMYAWEALFASAAWWILWRLASGRADGRAASSRASGIGGRAVAVHGVVLALAVAGELWTLALGLVVAAWQGLVIAVLRLASGRDPDRARRTAPARRTALLVALAAVLAGTLSFLPWLPRTFAAATSGEPYWTPVPGLFDWILTWQVALVGWRGDAIASWAVAPLLLLALAGVVALVRSRDAAPGRVGWLLLAGLALVPSVWAFSLVRSVYDHRYFGAAVGPLALAVAAGASVVVEAVYRRWPRFGRSGSPAIVAVLVVSLLAAPFAVDWVGRSRSDADGSPVRALVAAIAPRLQPGDSLLAIDARAFFPVAYEVARGAASDPRLRLPVLHWVSGNEKRYNGASLIDASADVDEAALRDQGVRAALRLGPQGRVWLIASGSDARGPFDIALLRDPSLTVVDRLLLGDDRWEPAQAVLIAVVP